MAEDFDKTVPLARAAELAGVHPQTLRKAVRLRELDSVKFRRAGSTRPRVYIRLSALDRWLKANTERASRLAGK